MSATRNLATFPNIFLLISFLLLAAACTEEASKKDKSSKEFIADSLAHAQANEADRISSLLGELENAPLSSCNVSRASVRQEPSLSSSEVDQVVMGEGLHFAGETGGDSTGVMMDGNVFVDRFALVLTPRGKVGWIHKGAFATDNAESKAVTLSLPMELHATMGANLVRQLWKNIFVAVGQCDGGGCPRYYTDANHTIMVMEVCDPMAGYDAGIHIFLPNNKTQRCDWWEEIYARETCHRMEPGIKRSYRIEKMAKDDQKVKEIRMKYDFPERYGEYLLELGKETAPFLLEEKTGTKGS